MSFSGFANTPAPSFGFGAFGQPQQPARGFGFGQEAAQQPAFEAQPFGQPAFGQPAFGQSAFGQPAFGQSAFGTAQQPQLAASIPFAFGQTQQVRPSFAFKQSVQQPCSNASTLGGLELGAAQQTQQTQSTGLAAMSKAPPGGAPSPSKVLKSPAKKSAAVTPKANHAAADANQCVIFITGEVNSGKSSLINALSGGIVSNTSLQRETFKPIW